MNTQSLQKFVDAQQDTYSRALSEIKAGKKQGHWIWFIFPQIRGLGLSETSKYYSIKNKKEAQEFLEHPVLGARLIEICKVLSEQGNYNASYIFGSPDDKKLRSSMTLFSSVKDADPVFKIILDNFFKGMPDPVTLKILGNQE